MDQTGMHAVLPRNAHYIKVQKVKKFFGSHVAMQYNETIECVVECLTQIGQTDCYSHLSITCLRL